VSVFYGKKHLLESVDFPKLDPAPTIAPERAEMGTQSHEGIAGAAAAVDFYASMGMGETRRECLQSAFEGLRAHSSPLVKRVWEGLSKINGVRLYGPPPHLERTPTVSFIVKHVASTEVARRLSERGLFASHGDFYAATVIERLGLAPEGLVRVGCACYTSEEEIERLIEAVEIIASGS
jgi:selenocysteine lyase/cysteine desulfurase